MSRAPAAGCGAGRRIDDGIDRGAPFEFTVDGEPVAAYPGETVAAALLAAGRRRFRETARRREPRGLYCGMGVCRDCVMVVDGRPNVRTCVTPAAPGLRVETQLGLGPGSDAPMPAGSSGAARTEARRGPGRGGEA